MHATAIVAPITSILGASIPTTTATIKSNQIQSESNRFCTLKKWKKKKNHYAPKIETRQHWPTWTMSSILHKKKKNHSKSGYGANGSNGTTSTIIHCNGKSSSSSSCSGGSNKKLYHKNNELTMHPQSQHHQRYKSASAASTGTRILHKRHNIVR